MSQRLPTCSDLACSMDPPCAVHVSIQGLRSANEAHTGPVEVGERRSLGPQASERSLKCLRGIVSRHPMLEKQLSQFGRQVISHDPRGRKHAPGTGRQENSREIETRCAKR